MFLSLGAAAEEFDLSTDEELWPSAAYSTPTKALSENEYPDFEDDIDFENMETVISRQIARYKKRSLSGTIQLGDTTYSLDMTLRSLEEFLVLVRKTQNCMKSLPGKATRPVCYQMLNQEIRSRFNVYVPDLQPGDPRYGETNTTLFTGYYTPTLKGSLTKTKDYPWAVYSLPSRSRERQKDREAIDFEGALDGKGHELFYTNNLFEVYLLHVEGGGKVEFVSESDGSKPDDFYLSYAGTNGQSWNFISKYMIQQGMISDPSIASQRRYLEAHPERQREVYSSCPSYVYFKKSQHQPEGSDLVSLTNRRSLATDSKLYRFKGLLTYVKTTRVDEASVGPIGSGKIRHKPFSRFFLDQDTGGAIKGKGRVDLYFGESHYAAVAASNQKATGELFYLMLKQ
ncbi:MAG: MltA domain-containing protein [Bdellovibrionales bacterium]|nr:MltA domain-containing protein [Bdellovibrionales bacterium]